MPQQSRHETSRLLHITVPKSLKIKREPGDPLAGLNRGEALMGSLAAGSKRKRGEGKDEYDLSKEKLIAVEKGYIDRDRHLEPFKNEQMARMGHLIFPTAAFRQSTDSIGRHKKAWKILLKVFSAYQDDEVAIHDLDEFIPGTSEAASLARSMIVNFDLISSGSLLRMNTGNRIITSNDSTPLPERFPVSVEDVGMRRSSSPKTPAELIRLLLRHCRTFIPPLISKAMNKIFETCNASGANPQLKRVLLRHKADLDEAIRHVNEIIQNGPSDVRHELDPSPCRPSPYNYIVHETFESLTKILTEMVRAKAARAALGHHVRTHLQDWEARYTFCKDDIKVWRFLRKNVAAAAAFARWAGAHLDLPDDKYKVDSFVDALSRQSAADKNVDQDILDAVKTFAIALQDPERLREDMTHEELGQARDVIAFHFNNLTVLVELRLGQSSDLSQLHEILRIMQEYGIKEYVQEIKQAWQRLQRRCR